MSADNNSRFGLLVCPKCKKRLFAVGNSLKCENNHCYDIASAGYVNLLPPHKKGDVPGDNKEMVSARRNFLSKGYYKPLKDKISEIISGIAPDVIVDIGCGEGYYTSAAGEYAECVLGFDISKYALAAAAKLDKNTGYCTANLHELPLENAVADMVLCCFCAHDEMEFGRILKKNGRFLLVTPGKRHLYGLKTVLYDEPYENTEETLQLQGFEAVNTEHVCYTAEIHSKEDIAALFMMTPYYWRSPKSGAQRLLELEVLKTEIDFILTEYKSI